MLDKQKYDSLMAELDELEIIVKQFKGSAWEHIISLETENAELKKQAALLEQSEEQKPDTPVIEQSSKTELKERLETVINRLDKYIGS